MTTATRDEATVDLTDEMLNALAGRADRLAHRLGEEFNGMPLTYVEADELQEKVHCVALLLGALEERQMTRGYALCHVIPEVQEQLSYLRDELKTSQEDLEGVRAGTVDPARLWGTDTIPTLQRAIPRYAQEIAALESFVAAVEAAQ